MLRSKLSVRRNHKVEGGGGVGGPEWMCGIAVTYTSGVDRVELYAQFERKYINTDKCPK